MSIRKYSPALIEEAVKIYHEKKSLQEAHRLTGVGKKTIYAEWRKWCVKTGYVSDLPALPLHIPLKYTIEQKTACIKLAVKYMNGGFADSEGAAFEKAGKVLGVRGKSIHEQWKSGVIRGLNQPSTQHPSGGVPEAANAGFSREAAILQSQRCLEQNNELVAIRPAARMIKRRKYTSEMIPPGVLKGHKTQTS